MRHEHAPEIRGRLNERFEWMLHAQPIQIAPYSEVTWMSIVLRTHSHQLRLPVSCPFDRCPHVAVADDGPGMPEAPDSMTHLMASLTSALEDGSQTTYKLQLRSTSTCFHSGVWADYKGACVPSQYDLSDP